MYGINFGLSPKDPKEMTCSAGVSFRDIRFDSFGPVGTEDKAYFFDEEVLVAKSQA
jgi:hypothetical protein